MSEWQKIETAPKDGTKFWGDVDGDGIAMFWHDGFSAFVSSFNRAPLAPGYTINGKPFEDHSPVVHEPTHWMPLPAPPAASEGE